MEGKSKILSLIAIICLALSFAETGEWWRISMLIINGLLLFRANY